MTGVAKRKKKKKMPAALKNSGAKGFAKLQPCHPWRAALASIPSATRNTKLNVQTRKVLRAHYAAKYRAG